MEISFFEEKEQEENTSKVLDISAYNWNEPNFELFMEAYDEHSLDLDGIIERKGNVENFDEKLIKYIRDNKKLGYLIIQEDISWEFVDSYLVNKRFKILKLRLSGNTRYEYLGKNLSDEDIMILVCGGERSKIDINGTVVYKHPLQKFKCNKLILDVSELDLDNVSNAMSILNFMKGSCDIHIGKDRKDLEETVLKCINTFKKTVRIHHIDSFPYSHDTYDLLCSYNSSEWTMRNLNDFIPIKMENLKYLYIDYSISEETDKKILLDIIEKYYSNLEKIEIRTNITPKQLKSIWK